MSTSTAACQRHQRVPMPEVRSNPQPQEKYEITMRIIDAPRPFEKVTGNAYFDIPKTDDDCIPVDYTIAPGGTKNNPHKKLPVEWVKVSDTEYRTEVFLDALLDEDYYGLGTCRWYLTAVSAHLTAEPAEFSTQIWNKTLVSGEEEVTFMRKRFFDVKPELIDFHPMTKAGMYFPGPDDFQVNFTARRVMP